MTLLAGDTKTITLPQGQTLVITATAGVGSITRLPDQAGNGDPFAPTAINNANLVIGPFTTVTRHIINITSGSIADVIIPYDPHAGSKLGDNASAGQIGELISASVASGSAVVLTTNQPANVTSISLTPGDWDVEGMVNFTPAASTSSTQVKAGVSAAGTATFDTFDRTNICSYPAEVDGANDTSLPVPETRISLTATTTIYLVAQSTFTVAAMHAYGIIRARRTR